MRKRQKNHYSNAYRRKLVVDYTPLAKSIARKFAYRAAYEDLLQEAFVALCDGVLYFDPARGVSFAAYTRMVISRRLLDYVSKQLPVHIGTNTHRISVIVGHCPDCTTETPCPRCETFSRMKDPVPLTDVLEEYISGAAVGVDDVDDVIDARRAAVRKGD